MLHRIPPLTRSFAAALVATALLAGTAQSAILLTWKQNGNDVVVTLSGSALIPVAPVSTQIGVMLNRFSDWSFDYIPVAQFHYVGLANPKGLPIISGTFDSSSTASVFSFNDRAVAFDFSLNAGDTWSPTGDLVIKNESFLTLFGSATPTLGPQGNWFNGTQAFSSTFVLVPEPSGSALLGIGLTPLILARRRSRLPG